MKTFATSEKQSVPATRKVRPYVHHPMGSVQLAQQAEIRRILHSTGAQAKLTIGQPNDKYEQEADYVADQVMAMPDPKLQRQPENEEEEETLQTKSLTEQFTPLVQRQEESPGPTPPTENPSLSGGVACVDREEIPGDHSGAQGLQGIVHDYFKMEADWDDTGPICRCTCGEYRQFVKGHVIVNNRRVRKRLYNNAYLEEDNYHEDADDEGRRPYGHRTGHQNTNNDQFIDPNRAGSDRESACSYRGYDTPGIPAPSGSYLDMYLKFKGQTYDRCRRRFGPIHEWESIWNDIVP